MSFFAVGAIGGALIGALGSNMAASKQAQGQQTAANTQQNMFNQVSGYEQPFRGAGYAANYDLSTRLGIGGGNPKDANYGSLTRGFTPQDYLANKDPGYQFQLQTGGQALRNQDTPGIGSLSGPALKDLMSFNQNMAATGYQNAFNRFNTTQNNTFDRLNQIANRGQNAAANTGQTGAVLGTGIAQAQAGAAASQAGGIVGATNSIGNGMGAAAYYWNKYQQSQNPDIPAGPGAGA